jgi:hypothetical protein
MSKTVTVPLKVDEFTMQLNDELFTDYGDRTMKAEFCLVFYLQTPDGSIEVNAQEAIVTINIDLNQLVAEFRLDAFNVQEKDINQEQGQDIVYGNVAYLCNSIDGSDTTTTTTTFTQGDIINVCVKPDPVASKDGIKIGSIESLTFARDGNGPNNSLNQDAVIGSIAATNGLSTYNDIDCYGKDYCYVSTILIASFFQTPGTVSGSGEASLTFYSTAERKKKRNLAEDAVTVYNSDQQYRSLPDNNNEVDGAIPAFDMNLNVIPADDSPTMFTSAAAASAIRRGKKKDGYHLLLLTTVSSIMTIMITVLLFS